MNARTHKADRIRAALIQGRDDLWEQVDKDDLIPRVSEQLRGEATPDAACPELHNAFRHASRIVCITPARMSAKRSLWRKSSPMPRRRTMTWSAIQAPTMRP